MSSVLGIGAFNYPIKRACTSSIKLFMYYIYCMIYNALVFAMKYTEFDTLSPIKMSKNHLIYSIYISSSSNLQYSHYLLAPFMMFCMVHSCYSNNFYCERIHKRKLHSRKALDLYYVQCTYMLPLSLKH